MLEREEEEKEEENVRAFAFVHRNDGDTICCPGNVRDRPGKLRVGHFKWIFRGHAFQDHVAERGMNDLSCLAKINEVTGR